jgi:tetratricopeptide (TPR) repeat protein
MLFDLRSRGRRRTVQAVYLTLAVLMGGGLILFGVGAGNGFGGLLNAFTGNGSSGNGTAAVSQAEKTALKATKLRPTDPTAWADLVQARYTAAGQGSNYNPNVVNAAGGIGDYTSSGKKELKSAQQAWQRYLTLTKSPDANLALLVARSYESTGDYGSAASTWEIVTAANPTTSTYYLYLAADAYKAKDTRLGDLAAAKALALTPKAERTTVKQQLQQAKSAATSTGTSTTGATGAAGASGAPVTTTR